MCTDLTQIEDDLRAHNLHIFWLDATRTTTTTATARAGENLSKTPGISNTLQSISQYSHIPNPKRTNKMHIPPINESTQDAPAFTFADHPRRFAPRARVYQFESSPPLPHTFCSSFFEINSCGISGHICCSNVFTERFGKRAGTLRMRSMRRWPRRPVR